MQDELDWRSSRLCETCFKASGLTERPTLTEFDWSFNPKLPKKEIYEMVGGRFIRVKACALCAPRCMVKLMFGANPIYIYRNVKSGKEQIYQAYFLKIIDSADMGNLTDQARNRPFIRESASTDSKTIEQFANQAKALD